MGSSTESTENAASPVSGMSRSTSLARLESETDSTHSPHNSPIPAQRLSSPLSTSSTDVVGTANAQLWSEYRASISPSQSRKTTTEARPEKFHYPKLSDLMRTAKDTPSQQHLPQSVTFKGSTKSDFEDGEFTSDTDANENSGSDEDELGPSMLKGLRNRMVPYVLRQSTIC